MGRPAMVPSHWDREFRPRGYEMGVRGPKIEVCRPLFGPQPRCRMRVLPGYLSGVQQCSLLAEIRKILEQAPLYSPAMPRSGSPYSVRMSNCGSHGWLSDRNGYRY